MDTTINQRVKEIADKLCDGNISEMARMIDVRQPSLRDIVTGKMSKPGFDILNKIVENSTLNINSEWLLKGKGAMQKHQVDIIYNPPYRDVGSGVIPIYDINAAANLQTLFVNDNKQLVLEEFTIPKAPNCDGAIYARGDSMDPEIQSGDIVAFKQISSLNNLRNECIHIVDYHLDGDDFLVIKYVQWEEEGTTLRLSSNNKYHNDSVIHASAVRSIALVKIIIKFKTLT